MVFSPKWAHFLLKRVSRKKVSKLYGQRQQIYSAQFCGIWLFKGSSHHEPRPPGSRSVNIIRLLVAHAQNKNLINNSYLMYCAPCECIQCMYPPHNREITSTFHVMLRIFEKSNHDDNIIWREHLYFYSQ